MASFYLLLGFYDGRATQATFLGSFSKDAFGLLAYPF
jgi:hypothetical protein